MPCYLPTDIPEKYWFERKVYNTRLRVFLLFFRRSALQFYILHKKPVYRQTQSTHHTHRNQRKDRKTVPASILDHVRFFPPAWSHAPPNHAAVSDVEFESQCKNKKLSYRRWTARCVVSVEILPIATQQCRNYLYDKSWTKRNYEVWRVTVGRCVVNMCTQPWRDRVVSIVQ